jgi:hypothetical protein
VTVNLPKIHEDEANKGMCELRARMVSDELNLWGREKKEREEEEEEESCKEEMEGREVKEKKENEGEKVEDWLARLGMIRRVS